jgi:hypothetical protein
MKRHLAFAGLVALLAAALAPSTLYAAGPFQFHAITPCRVFDTRVNGGQTTGNPLPNPGPHFFRIQGNCGVPNGAAAVTLNATITQPSTGGDLRLYPSAATVGLNDPSTLNYNAGEPALANGAILPLSAVAAASDKDMKLLIGMIGSGSVHVIVDVTGYFQ